VLRDKVREEVISTLGDPNGALVGSMRPAFSRRVRTRLVSPDSTQARRGASRTARLVFSSPTPVAWDRH
jgi:hypothetical protein